MSHWNILVNVRAMAANFGLHRTTQLSVLPLYHAHAFNFGLMTALLTEGHLVFTDHFDPFVWTHLINEERVTVTSAFPTLLPLLLRAKIRKVDVPQLRCVMVTSAPLPSRVAAAFEKLRVGPALDDLDVGPVVSAAQRDRVRGFVTRAQGDGIAEIARASLADDLPAQGFYVAPALFGPVPETAELHRDEVFGPVLAALPFRDEADAIRLANATDFGLCAGLWTENGGRQARVSRAVRAGQVFINCYGAGGGVELPFGGSKKSGHGREKGLAALDEFSTLKTVALKYA